MQWKGRNHTTHCYLHIIFFIGPVQTLLSQKATSKQRLIDEVLERQGDSDTLIVTELSQLGRSTLEAIAPGSLLNKFVPLTYKGILYLCYRKFSVAFCDSNVCTTHISHLE